MGALSRFAVASIALSVAAPAYADEFYAVTPSGRAEAIFDKPVRATSDRLANTCLDGGWTVISTTETVVVCEAPMSFGQTLLSALAIGNRYSTPPKMYYRFNLAGVDGSTRVQVNGWIETQMAFGQIQRGEFTGPPFHNSAIDLLRVSGGRLPPGTTFPNHVYLGAAFAVVQSPQQGLRVTEVENGSPSFNAGLRVGDVITRIAGERIKDADDLLDALAKSAKATTYQVELYRDGGKSSVSVNRAFRAAVVAPIDQPQEAPPPVAVAPAAAPPGVSLADEIAKFAKLRADGIITAEEFEAQKAKLLGQ